MNRLFRKLGDWRGRRSDQTAPALPTITVPSDTGPESYTPPPRENPGRDSVLQFSAPKCGAVMSTGIVQSLAKFRGLKFRALMRGLEVEFAEVMQTFGYQPHQAGLPSGAEAKA